MRARLHRERRDLPAALADEARAVELDPDNADYRSSLGRLRHAADGTAEGAAAALADLTAAVDLAPDSATPRERRADFLTLTNRHAEALPDYDRAIALEPEHPGLHFHRAVALRHASEDQASMVRALADLDRCLALGPDPVTLAETHWWRGDTLEALGEEDEALAAFTRAIAFDPTYRVAYESRGMLRDDRGDDEGAAADFAQADALRAAEEGDDDDDDRADA